MLFDQSAYWDQVAHKKTFSHPVDWAIFSNLFPINYTLLDYGCGYGRILDQLHQKGYRHLIGIDYSQEMIEIAKTVNPEIDFRRNRTNHISLADQSIDGVLLFAVLTCMPFNQDQKALIAEINRVLRPGGRLYLSDLLLNADERNLKRYEAYANKYEIYGTFELPEGGVFRHHSKAWLLDLLQLFTIDYQKELDFITMNGNKSKGIQLIVRK